MGTEIRTKDIFLTFSFQHNKTMNFKLRYNYLRNNVKICQLENRAFARHQMPLGLYTLQLPKIFLWHVPGLSIKTHKGS